MRLNLDPWIHKDFDIDTDLVVSVGIKEAKIPLKDAKGNNMVGMEKTVWVVDIMTFLPIVISLEFDSKEEAKNWKRKYFKEGV